MNLLEPPRANPHCLGHEPITAVFERAISSKRMPHAWLLLGPKGVGKATLAFALARRLLDREGGPPDDPKSVIFRQIAQSSHPDLYVLERRPHPKTGKMQTEIVVDSVREVIDAMHRTTAWSGRRVLIIDSIDELNRNAENALLKLLEEPPPGSVILLVCHRPGSVPRTILSRCAQMRARPPSVSQGQNLLLQAFPDLSAQQAAALLAFAEGSPGMAMTAHEHGLLERYNELTGFCRSESEIADQALKMTDNLLKTASEAGIAAACAPLSQLSLRAARLAGGGYLATPLYDREEADLRQIVERLPLEHWLSMWDKLVTLPAQIDGLNLDPYAMLFTHLRALMGEQIPEQAL